MDLHLAVQMSRLEKTETPSNASGATLLERRLPGCPKSVGPHLMDSLLCYGNASIRRVAMSIAAWLSWEHLVSHVRSNPVTTESRSSNRTDDSREGESFDVKEAASEAKSAAQERVVAGADAGVGKAADGFGAAAEKMRDRADQDDGLRSTLETKAADAMEKTAGYLKDRDSNELVKDLEEFVKAHPIQAALGALAAGYFLGKIAR